MLGGAEMTLEHAVPTDELSRCEVIRRGGAKPGAREKKELRPGHLCRAFAAKRELATQAPNTFAPRNFLNQPLEVPSSPSTRNSSTWRV
jgi:hypothetical protein